MSKLQLGQFALRLATAFRTWKNPSDAEPADQYFSGNLQRHQGDEFSLRTSLIKDCILEQGFGYASDQIVIEANDRSDVVLYAGDHPVRVAIIETKKSGFGDLLNTVQPNGETPLQQLERYMRPRGLYLGALTNGEMWHIIDLGAGLEPRASFSLKQLAELLEDVTDPVTAERILEKTPSIKNALLIAQTLLEASKWAEVDSYLLELRDEIHFHSKALDNDADRSGLVEQIKQELSSLRNAIMAQFSLLQEHLSQFRPLIARVDETDIRPFREALDHERTELLEYIPSSARSEFAAMLDELITGFLDTGDVDGFYW